MRDRRLGDFLVIVRRKPVFFRRGKRLKKGPDFAACLTQQFFLFFIGGKHFAHRLTAQPTHQQRRQTPKNADR